MTTAPSPEEIEHFLNHQLTLWNAKDREGMTALYRKYAADELTIEYVGQPKGDGWAAYNHMWDNYGGAVQTTPVLIIVNGNEGMCHYLNTRVATGEGNPSIEHYKFEPGKLHIRYFHRPHKD